MRTGDEDDSLRDNQVESTIVGADGEGGLELDTEGPLEEVGPLDDADERDDRGGEVDTIGMAYAKFSHRG